MKPSLHTLCGSLIHVIKQDRHLTFQCFLFSSCFFFFLFFFSFSFPLSIEVKGTGKGKRTFSGSLLLYFYTLCLFILLEHASHTVRRYGCSISSLLIFCLATKPQQNTLAKENAFLSFLGFPCHCSSGVLMKEGEKAKRKEKKFSLSNTGLVVWKDHQEATATVSASNRVS